MQLRDTSHKSRVMSSIYDTANRPAPLWEELAAAWKYRDLVSQLVSRDLKLRYKRSVLGVVWTMLNPLAMMLVLTLVFSHLFRFTIPYYSVYVLSGMVLWNLFAQSTTSAMSALVWGGPLLSRIYAPRTLFALTAVGTGLANLLISLGPLAAIMAATGVPFRPALVWILAPIILTAVFALGVALLLSTVAISFPDLVEMYQIALSAWYFLTPVLYPIAILPENSRGWLQFNPMYYLVELFRVPIYSGNAFDTRTLLVAVLISVAVLIVGWTVFTARADKIAYRI